MLDYDTTMNIGKSRYQDVLDQLGGAGLGATFTQTGGMNAALEVVLDGGHTLLITDAEDALSWDREEHRGWGVGLYPPDHANEGGDCLAFDSTDDGSPGGAGSAGPLRARRLHAQPPGLSGAPAAAGPADADTRSA